MSDGLRFMVRARVLTLLAVVMVMAGCNGWGKKPPEHGPIVQRSTQGLLKQINDNSRLIRNFRSRVNIKVELPGEKHSVGGHLILRKPIAHFHPPKDLLLKGSDTIGAVNFQMGSNNNGYWYMLDAPGSKDDTYSFVPYGKDVDTPAARTPDLLRVLGVSELTVGRLYKDPWLLREHTPQPYSARSCVQLLADGSLRVLSGVLGMYELAVDMEDPDPWPPLLEYKAQMYSALSCVQLLADGSLRVLSGVFGLYSLAVEMEDPGPWPLLRGYEAPPYYVLSFVERLPNGSLRVRKDIWWHRRKQQIDLIELFDEKGHRYLSAALDDYQQFEGAKLATKIYIVWEEKDLSLELKLRDVQVNSPTKVSDKNFIHRPPSWARKK